EWLWSAKEAQRRKTLGTPLDLPGVPEPLLVLGRSLPALVGGARSDQVHVGAEVAAAGTGAFARTVGMQPEVLGPDLLRNAGHLEQQAPALIPGPACPRIRAGGCPEVLPIHRVLDSSYDAGPLYIGKQAQQIDVRGIEVLVRVPAEQAAKQRFRFRG